MSACYQAEESKRNSGRVPSIEYTPWSAKVSYGRKPKRGRAALYHLSGSAAIVFPPFLLYRCGIRCGLKTRASRVELGSHYTPVGVRT